jgi:WD40 repeat protein
MATVPGQVQRLATRGPAHLVVGVLLPGALLALWVGQVSLRGQEDRPPPPAAAQRHPVKHPKPATDPFGDPLPPGALARMGTVRWRHHLTIDDVAFSSDGKLVATSGLDQTIRLWDSTGKGVRTLQAGNDVFAVALSPDGKSLAAFTYGPGIANPAVRIWDLSSGKAGHLIPIPLENGLSTVAFSPDSKHLAAGAARMPPGAGALFVWSVGTGKEVLRLKVGSDMVGCVAFSPDGKYLASGGSGPVRIWDAVTGKEVRRVPGSRKGTAHQLGFSPDGKSLAVATLDGVHLWETANGRKVRTFPGVNFAFSPDGKSIVTGPDERTYRRWEVATGKQLGQINNCGVSKIAFRPDGKVVAVIDHQTIGLWDPDTGRRLHPDPGHPGAVRALCFSPDGRVLASGGNDGTVYLWETATGRQRFRLDGHTDFIVSVTFSQNGRMLASADYHGTVRLWDVNTGRQILAHETRQQRPSGVAISPAGSTLAVVTPDRRIHIWDARTGRKRCAFAVGLHSPTLAFVDERRLAAGGYEGVILWNLETGKKFSLLSEEKSGAFSSLSAWAFSPDRTLVACSGTDGAIRVWGMADGENRLTLPRIGVEIRRDTLAFAPDGRTLLAQDREHTWYLWELTTGKEIHPFRHEDRLRTSGVLAPGGLPLIEELQPRVPRVWDAASKREVLRLPTDDSIWSCAFAADGRRLATGTYNGLIHVWDLPLPPAGQEWGDEQKDRLWAALAGNDAPGAFKAITTLIAVRDTGVSLLEKRLRKVRPVTEEVQAQRLLSDLDSPVFAVREAASRKLRNLGPAVVPVLRRVLLGKPSLEVRRRIERILAALPRDRILQGGETLRGVRAVQVLEAIGSARARGLLKTLAGQDAGLTLTEEANAALRRLEAAVPSSAADRKPHP